MHDDDGDENDDDGDHNGEDKDEDERDRNCDDDDDDDQGTVKGGSRLSVDKGERTPSLLHLGGRRVFLRGSLLSGGGGLLVQFFMGVVSHVHCHR